MSSKKFNFIENQSLGWYLTKSARVVNRYYHDALEVHKLCNSKSEILFLLYQAKKEKVPLSQKEVAEFLFLQKVNTHKLINQLIKDQLIETGLDPMDKRQHIVMITSKGSQLVDKLAVTHKKIDKLLEKTFNFKVKSQRKDFEDSLKEILLKL